MSDELLAPHEPAPPPDAEAPPAAPAGPDSAPPRRRWGWLLGLRLIAGLAALVTIGVCVYLWPRTDSGYGPVFWVWLAAIVVWSAAFWAVAGTTREAREQRPRVDWPVLMALLGLAVALRLPFLEQWPEYVHRDEIMCYDYVKKIDNGTMGNVLSSMPWHNSPAMQIALRWPAVRLFDYTVFAARLTAAVLSIVAVLATYMIALRIGGRRLALFSSLALLLAWFFLHFSRTGTPFTQPPFFAALVVWLVLRALQDRRPSAAVLAGIVLGLGLGSYAPIRILLPTLALWWLSVFLLRDLPDARRAWRSAPPAPAGPFCLWRHPLLGHSVLFALIVLSALLVFGPFLRMDPTRKPDLRFLAKPAEITITNEEVFKSRSRLMRADSRLELAWKQLVQKAMPGIWGGPHWSGNKGLAAYGTECESPALDRITLVLVGIGLAWVLVRYRNPALPWVFWVIALTIVAGMAMSLKPNATYRLCVAYPALAVAAGLGLDAVYRLLGWLGRRVGRWGAWIAPAGAMVLVAAMATANFRLIAHAYGADPYRGNWESALTRYYMQRGADPVYFMVIGTMKRKHIAGFQYLPWGGRFFNMGNPQHWVPELVQRYSSDRDAVVVMRAELGAWADWLRTRYPTARVLPLVNSAGECMAYACEIDKASLRNALPGNPAYGLLARYYTTHSYTGPVAEERIDPLASYVSTSEYRRPDTESVEWTGTLVPPIPGEYTFRLKCSRASLARTWVSLGQKPLAQDNQQVSLVLSDPVPLTIRFSCRQATETVGYWLEWAPPGRTDFSLVPHEVFRPATPEGDIAPGP